MHHALRAFRHTNYARYFAGQSVSIIGTWIQQIGISWLVYRLTKSPLLLGISGFAGQIPAFFLAPVAGVWVDRMRKRQVLIVTQLVALTQSLVMLSQPIGHWRSRVSQHNATNR